MMLLNPRLPWPVAGVPGVGQRGDRVAPGLRGQVGADLGDDPVLRRRAVVGEPEPQVVVAAGAAQRLRGGNRGVEDRYAGAVRAGSVGEVQPGPADAQPHGGAAGGPHAERAASRDGVAGGLAVGDVGERLTRPGQRAGHQQHGVDRRGGQAAAVDHDVLGAAGRRRGGDVAEVGADRGDARQPAERAELGGGQAGDTGGDRDLVEAPLLHLAVHRRVQQAGHGEEAQAGDGDGQRASGQQGPGAVPGQVGPGLPVQGVHGPASCRCVIRPSRTDTMRWASRASAVVVGDVHDRGALLVQVLEQLEHVHGHAGIEVAGELVAQQDRRLAGHRPGDRDPLLLPAGQLQRQPAAAVGEPDGGEVAVWRRPCARGRCRSGPGPAAARRSPPR